MVYLKDKGSSKEIDGHDINATFVIDLDHWGRFLFRTVPFDITL